MQTDRPRGIHVENLRLLVALRWFVIAGCFLLLWFAQVGIELVVAPPLAWVSLAIYALANVGVRLFIRRRSQLSESFLLLNLALDVVVLFTFLYVTGGPNNPFTLLFLLPVIVASAALRPSAIWVVTGLMITAYTLLFLWYTPTHHHGTMRDDFDLHIMGMLMGVVFIAALVAYYAAHMGQVLRRRERQLARVREKALRDERVIALGALAAGAAHELGTPLGTIAVLAREIEREYGDQDAKLKGQLQMLRGQLERCNSVLSGLTAHGHEIRAQSGGGLTPCAFLRQLVGSWREFRPGVDIRFVWRGPEYAQPILADQTLSQALSSLFNNAADVSPDVVAVTGQCRNGHLLIDIEDRGGGISDQVVGRLGREPVTTKFDQGGMGIGVLLANSVIERLGGRIKFEATEGDGTRIRIELPLARLTVAAGQQEAPA